MFRRPRTGLGRTRSVGLAAALVVGLVLVAAPPASAAAPEESQEAADPTSAFTGPANSANARFVVAAYRELLGREPDTAGLDFHLARLTSGGDRSREAFAYGLAFSVEGSRRQVDRAYRELLGRAADSTGRAYWTSHLQGQGVLDLRVLLLASDEYHNRAGGTDQAWIDALYADVLGRAADAPGRQYWLARAAAGVPRALIAAGIHLGDEALGRRATTSYQEALGRAPSAAERAGAAELIRRIGERGLRARLVASDEAFETHLQAALS
jgi:hypothetical protein